MYNAVETNKSFSDVVDFLRKREIDVAYILRLNNKELLNINPWSEDLTSDQKNDIIKECMENVWYYIRCIARVYKQGCSTVLPIGLNVGTMAMITAYDRGYRTMVILPRQMGLYHTYRMLIEYTRVFKQDITSCEVQYISDHREIFLPKWMRDLENVVGSKYHYTRGNTSRNKSVSEFENIGRSLSDNELFMDFTNIFDYEKTTFINSIPVRELVRKSYTNTSELFIGSVSRNDEIRAIQKKFYRDYFNEVSLYDLLKSNISDDKRIMIRVEPEDIIEGDRLDEYYKYHRSIGCGEEKIFQCEVMLNIDYKGE